MSSGGHVDRVVSLLPSATEIVVALGQSASLVGRSHECDYPAEITRLPVCCRSRVDVDASSREIDVAVKSRLTVGLSIFEVLPDVLDRLQPTVVLTQTQCEVCAVSLRDVEQALGRIAQSKPTLISLEPNCLDDVWRDFRSVARALDCDEQGEQLVARAHSRLAAIAEVANSACRRPRVACIEWLDPLMAAGNWIPELVQCAGGEDLLGTAGAHSPWLEWDDLVATDPDVIIVHPCGFDIARTRGGFGALADHPQWPGLRAVRTGNVFLIDGNQYLNRPGPRLVDSVEILAEILHPSIFHFGHEGRGWERL